jgi:hypothetical protein
MPYTRKQQKLFHAAAENPAVAKKTGIPQSKAKQLAKESDEMPLKKMDDKRPKIKKPIPKGDPPPGGGDIKNKINKKRMGR